MYNYYGDSDGCGKYVLYGLIVLVVLAVSFSRCSSEQSLTKNWGGTMNIDLEPNEKLVEITWKDDSLWLLTKDMQEGDIAENYKFQEKDVTGWLEGSVTIKESKLQNDELEEYNLQNQLEQDYNKSGNFVYDDNDITQEPTVVFIKYDEVNDKYVKIKEYEYDGDSLVEKK